VHNIDLTIPIAFLSFGLSYLVKSMKYFYNSSSKLFHIQYVFMLIASIAIGLMIFNIEIRYQSVFSYEIYLGAMGLIFVASLILSGIARARRA